MLGDDSHDELPAMLRRHIIKNIVSSITPVAPGIADQFPPGEPVLENILHLLGPARHQDSIIAWAWR